MKLKLTFFFTVILLFKAFPQNNQPIIVTGDSLIGKSLNGQTIREVYGNVVLKQGNVIVNCKKAIQYLAKNEAELIGDVVVKQDTITLITERGYYFGNERKAESANGLKLDDGKVILTADSGKYYFDRHYANFNSQVLLYDTATTLTADRLHYYKDENKSIAVGNVKINDGENIIYADSLINFRDTRQSFAFNNVEIKNIRSNILIFGNHLEDYPQKHFSLIDRDPLLFQIDTTYRNVIDSLPGGEHVARKEIKLDTLIISAEVMKAYNDSSNYFEAIDSVKIYRGNFASVNNYSIYFRSLGMIITKKTSPLTAQPVLWYNNTQITGDSVTIFTEDNKVKKVFIDRNAFLLSYNERYKDRFNQLSGERFVMTFGDEGLEKNEVYGNVRSIYYLYEDDTPNGLTKSSANNTIMEFENKEVAVVRLYGLPNSEYYPENQIEGLERSFTLPGFYFYNNRPKKQFLLSGVIGKIK